MVTVSAINLRAGEKGTFITLELMGPPEFIQSQKTGRFYLSSKRCTISTTFGEETARALIGTKFPGSIVRVEVDPYEYTLPESGEQILLVHRWDYQPEEAPARNVVMANQV